MALISADCRKVYLTTALHTAKSVILSWPQNTTTSIHEQIYSYTHNRLELKGRAMNRVLHKAVGDREMIAGWVD